MNPSNEKVEEKFDDPLESFENNVNINNEKESRNEEVNKISEEEKQSIKETVMNLKAEGIKDYCNKEFVNALNKFSLCITNSEMIENEESELMSILYCNRGLCFLKSNDDTKALEDFSKSINFNKKYVKSYINRMLIFYKREEYIEALDESELNHKAEIKKKQMTEEVVGKLKDLGNSFLGMFGMSVDNFKMNPNPQGGYSISIEK